MDKNIIIIKSDKIDSMLKAMFCIVICICEGLLFMLFSSIATDILFEYIAPFVLFISMIPALIKFKVYIARFQSRIVLDLEEDIFSYVSYRIWAHNLEASTLSFSIKEVKKIEDMQEEIGITLTTGKTYKLKSHHFQEPHYKIFKVLQDVTGEASGKLEGGK